MKHLLLLAVVLSMATNVRAVTCYALTETNHLLRFDSATPGTVTDTTITGFPKGFNLVGMALRTTTQTLGAANGGGSLWAVARNALGTDHRLYVINRTTGAATQISLLGALNSGPGDYGWSLAFNPAIDRFQFLGVQFNYQINPNTGGVVQQGNLGPAFPAFSGAAFTTASYGGTSRFYNIDCGGTPDSLQTMTNVSAGGNPTIVGPLGMDMFLPVPLAIDKSVAFLAFNGNLYSENLSTGAATLVGAIMGAPTLRGLVIYPTRFPPTLSVTVNIKGKKKFITTKGKLKIKGTATSEAGIKLVQVKIGKEVFKPAKGTKIWEFTARLKPGKNKIIVLATGGNDILSRSSEGRDRAPISEPNGPFGVVKNLA